MGIYECDREKIQKYIQPINAEYDSPIRLFYHTVDNTLNQIKGSCEQAVYQAVCNLGIDIDKDKLEQAIHQDRERYEEAYRRGYNKAKEDIVRCKDCKYWYPLTKTCNNVDGACCQSYVADDWFCADGEPKEQT